MPTHPRYFLHSISIHLPPPRPTFTVVFGHHATKCTSICAFCPLLSTAAGMLVIDSRDMLAHGSFILACMDMVYLILNYSVLYPELS